MPNYAPTDWADGITPVDEAHLDKIEQGVAAAVPRDGSVAAAGVLYQSKLLSADAQPAFRQSGNGKMEWGAGGASVPNANLYRSATAMLKTDGGLTVRDALHVDLVDGGLGYGLVFGSGEDTYLYRSAAGELTTDGNFKASLFHTIYGRVSSRAGLVDQITLGDRAGDGVTPQITFGSAGDTNLYRAAADVLKTDDNFQVAGYSLLGIGQAAGSWALASCATGDPQMRFTLSNKGEMIWGTGAVIGDTSLYRSAAGVLKTDGMLDALTGFLARGTGASWTIRVLKDAEAAYRFGVDANGKLLWDSGTAGTYDTNLYRVAAGELKTDGYLYSGQAFYAYHGTANQVGLVAVSGAYPGVVFGNAGDTVLYRAGAGILRTDGSLQVAGTIYAIGSGWNFMAGGDAYMRVGIYSPQSAIYFGAGNIPEDTYLSRISPGILGINGVPLGFQLKVFRGIRWTATAVGPAAVTFETVDVNNLGALYGDFFAPGVAGVYLCILSANFASGSGDGDQFLRLDRYSGGGSLLESFEVSRNVSASNGWNRGQSGSCTLRLAADEGFRMVVGGGATGTPGNYDRAELSIIKIA